MSHMAFKIIISNPISVFTVATAVVAAGLPVVTVIVQ